MSKQEKEAGKAPAQQDKEKKAGKIPANEPEAQQPQQETLPQEEKPGEEGSLPEVIQLKREEFLEVKNHIAGLEKERDEMKALAQRVQADFDNFRRRNATVMTDCREEGLRSCIKELLPVLDNFDRAMESAKGVQNDWLEGVRLVQRQLMETLGKCGLKEIPAEGMFDPNLHEAVMQEAAEGAESGAILAVFQKGYQVNDRIIRHSMVKVAQ
ncbi:MAG TPA: nucleotide exchange factor GrpE [Candidatus Pelethousia gallinarum]|nr:nucleotide exchange factor GrpE [Candidatus Pelethousia gallinarum]